MSAGKVVVENMRASAVFLPNVESTKLVPGDNEISPAIWDSVKDHHAVKTFLRVEMLIDKGIGKAKPLIEQIQNQHVQDALKFIAAATDISLLKKWRKNDKRSVVRKEINRRIQEVSDGDSG